MGETIGYDFHFDVQDRMYDKRKFMLNVSIQWGPGIRHMSIHRILCFSEISNLEETQLILNLKTCQKIHYLIPTTPGPHRKHKCQK